MADLPFLPYARQLVEDDDVAAVVRALKSTHLTSGPEIVAFERELADAVGAPWAVAVASGTAALHAAVDAAGIGPGDEVIVPAITFVASANCARFVGAEPVFADVNPGTGLIDPESVAARVTARTRAIIAVHLAGEAGDMQALAAIASGAGAMLIEDAAHALGGSVDGSRIGACDRGSSLATFSFHPVKHVAMGEGGAVSGRDDRLRARLQRFRDHGIVRHADGFAAPSPGPWYYEQQFLGHNLRLGELQAALGRSQLAKLERFVARRRELVRAYDRRLHGLRGVEPVKRDAGCAYHLYTVRIDFDALGIGRGDVMTRMREMGVGTQVHYIPVPGQPYYQARGWNADAFPGAQAYYAGTLSLPLFPGMHDGDVERVVTALEAAIL